MHTRDKKLAKQTATNELDQTEDYNCVRKT